MEGRQGQPAEVSAGPGITTSPPEKSPLVGRRDVLRRFEEALEQTAAGSFQFLGLVGEPGAGKTRLLAELATGAEVYGLPCVGGRAAEFEHATPLGVVVHALDDLLESGAANLPERIGAVPARLLATVFPSLSSALPDGPPPDSTGSARYRLYRAVRQLLDELAHPSGLVLLLDDVHWADDTSIEFLEHLVRHPPRGRVLMAAAYRPAQAPPRLNALVDQHGQRVAVGPLTEQEVAEFLGTDVNAARTKALYAASGGNPFYLEALARMAETGGTRMLDEWIRRPAAPGGVSGSGGAGMPAVGAEGLGDGRGVGLAADAATELPPAVRTALWVELSGLSEQALLVARAAAVAADEFEPRLAAVAADVTEDVALAALDELVARDVVRPGESPGGRFRFRHPLVRNAVYGSAAAGWRLGAHARIADHLAALGAPATVRAHHVERSGRFGDQEAIATLVEAARTVSPHAPSMAAHWLRAALRLMPDDRETRLSLLLELATAQAVSGQITEGRDTAREVLRLLPHDDHERRARAARICAMMERHLGRPHQGRTVLLDELRRLPDPRSAVALPLRLRLVADSLMRSDFRAAQAVLDLMPDDAPGWEPSLPLAIASMRPLPALAAGRIADGIRYVERADRLMAEAADEHVAESLDTVAWLCWTETIMGRHARALAHLERAVDVARATGQSYIVPNLQAGQARALTALGRLAEAALVAEEAAEVARLLVSGQHLVFALIQQSLIAHLLGEGAAALRLAEEALATGAGRGEWWGSMARYARAHALFGDNRLDEGAETMREALRGTEGSPLDPASQLAGFEFMAHVEAVRGNAEEAATWAARAGKLAHPALPITVAYAKLARAKAESLTEPAAAAADAAEAARVFGEEGLRLDAARARLHAGTAYAAARQKGPAKEHLRAAAETFARCGAVAFHAQAVRAQRRIGIRVPSSGRRGTGPYGLSRREFEVAQLVAEGCTNQQIAEKLVLSVRTIETHLSNIFSKLGVNSRVGVVNALKESSDRGGADRRPDASAGR